MSLETPLYIAALCGSTEVVATILDAAAAATAPAAEVKQVQEFVVGRLEHPAPVEVAAVGVGRLVGFSYHDGWTPLHASCLKGGAEAVVLLLRAGFDPNAENKYRQTALHVAARQGGLKVVEVRHPPTHTHHHTSAHPRTHHHHHHHQQHTHTHKHTQTTTNNNTATISRMRQPYRLNDGAGRGANSPRHAGASSSCWRPGRTPGWPTMTGCSRPTSPASTVQQPEGSGCGGGGLRSPLSHSQLARPPTGHAELAAMLTAQPGGDKPAPKMKKRGRRKR